MLIYIHGFNSSPLSFKAALVRKRMTELGRGREFVCPELPDRPARAIALLDALLVASDQPNRTLIGSSLGGYYATHIAEKHGLRAVLVNPAVRPYNLLQHALGRQTNLYTGVQYDVTHEHLSELRALEVDSIHADRYLLLVRTGDEVLDYRDAVERYRGCDQMVEAGGDHGFSDFDRHLDGVLEFCGIPATANGGSRL
jgi:predicted esterase YcpF (UPF0227 family)